MNKTPFLSKNPNKVSLLPTMFAISSSMLFSAQAQGRDPTTWPWAPLRVTVKVRKCTWRQILVYGKGEGASSLHLGPLVHLLLHIGPGHPGLQTQRVAHHVDAVLLAVNQRQVSCREDTQTIFYQFLILYCRQHRMFARVSSNTDSSTHWIRFDVRQDL